MELPPARSHSPQRFRKEILASPRGGGSWRVGLAKYRPDGRSIIPTWAERSVASTATRRPRAVRLSRSFARERTISSDRAGSRLRVGQEAERIPGGTTRIDPPSRIRVQRSGSEVRPYRGPWLRSSALRPIGYSGGRTSAMSSRGLTSLRIMDSLQRSLEGEEATRCSP